MKKVFDGLAAKFGRMVVCRDRSGVVTGEGMAFVQPITEKQWQKSAGVLGAFRTDRFLCLAPASLPVGEAGDGGWLEWNGGSYVVMAAHDICFGSSTVHRWVVLEPRDEVAV